MREITQAHAFEPFFTTKRVGEGTGLGLAMVYGLVKQHDGFVQLYSEPGLGTTFRLYFPVTAAAPPEADKDGDGASTGALHGKGETVLLVEDEEALRNVSKRVLERNGYEVVIAVDGANALELWRADPTRFDLVMSDLVMPNVGGAELARALSRQSDPPKILLVSGYSGTEMAQRSALDPAIPLLQKPWSVADLLRHVRELLDG